MQDEHDADQNRCHEEEGTATPKSGPGVVGPIANKRIGDGVYADGDDSPEGEGVHRDPEFVGEELWEVADFEVM